MQYKDFELIVNKYIEHNKNIDSLKYIDLEIFDNLYWIIEKLIDNIYNSEGIELFDRSISEYSCNNLNFSIEELYNQMEDFKL